MEPKELFFTLVCLCVACGRGFWENFSSNHSLTVIPVLRYPCHIVTRQGPWRPWQGSLRKAPTPQRTITKASEWECHQKETATPRSKYLFRFIRVPLPPSTAAQQTFQCPDSESCLTDEYEHGSFLMKLNASEKIRRSCWFKWPELLWTIGLHIRNS